MVRTIDFRFVIRKNGADYCQLYSLSSSPPTVKMSESSIVKTSFSGDFLIPEKEINWLTDEIQAKLIIDGTATSCGVFLPSVVSEHEDGTNRFLHIFEVLPGGQTPVFCGSLETQAHLLLRVPHSLRL